MTESAASAFEYLNFDIDVRPRGQDGRYPISVDSPAGQTPDDAYITLSFTEAERKERLTDIQTAVLLSAVVFRQAVQEDEEPVQKFGRELFDSVFTGKVRDLYIRSQERAEHEGKGLRLRLRLQPPEVAMLPWETLWDPDKRDYLALEQRTPLVRYLKQDKPMRPLQVAGSLRILAMQAVPSGVARLQSSSHEKAALESAVRKLQERGLPVMLDWVKGETSRDLADALEDTKPHIFHFIGHGGFDVRRDEGYIVLADEQGNPRTLLATDLARLLTDRAKPAVVMLNSCQTGHGSERDLLSSTASILARRDIPAVVAMQYPISDDAATEFSRSLYDALARGKPVDTAVAAARNQVKLERESLEWATAVLYMRSPDGRIFQPVARLKSDDRVDDGAVRSEEGPAVAVVETPEQKELVTWYQEATTLYGEQRWDQATELLNRIEEKRPGYERAAEMLREARRQQQMLQQQPEDVSSPDDLAEWLQALSRQAIEPVANREAWLQKVALAEECLAGSSQGENTRRTILDHLYDEAKQRTASNEWTSVRRILAKIRWVDPTYPDTAHLHAQFVGARSARVAGGSGLGALLAFALSGLIAIFYSGSLWFPLAIVLVVVGVLWGGWAALRAFRE